MTPLAARFLAMPGDDGLNALPVVAGSVADYRSLQPFHYRDHKPATMTRVFSIRHTHATSIAPAFPTRMVESMCVAVLVESMPPLAGRMRDAVLSQRYSQVKNSRTRAAMINREFRTISRVIVHPQFRGLGLARRLVRAALASSTTPFTEAFAAMGRVHPFFVQAGMSAHLRPPHRHNARLRAVFRTLSINEVTLASVNLTLQRIRELPANHQAWLMRELQRWHRTTNRQVLDTPLNGMLEAAQRSLICEPVYFIHDNRNRAEKGEHA